MRKLIVRLSLPMVFPLLVNSVVSQTAGSSHAQVQSEWKLASAPIKSLVKKRILAELDKYGDFYGTDEADEERALQLARVKFVRLNSEGRKGIVVVSPPMWCGATGNCQVWVFDGENGDLLVQDLGWDYGFRRTSHHGVFDFYIRASMGPESGTRHEYHFDGKVYQQVQEIDGTSY